MENFSHDPLPELVFGSANSAISQAIRRAVKAGKLRKIAPKLYSANFKDSPSTIISKHRFQILDQRFPGAVISHRSALEGGMATDGSIVLTYKYTKKITLPGLVIKCFRGPKAHKDDTRFLNHLHIASRARAYLENMQSARKAESLLKIFSRQEVEKKLEQMIRIYGEEELNVLREQAHSVSKDLKMKKEFKELDSLIGAILGTQSDKNLTNEAAKARARGKPYDPNRVELFATLVASLQTTDIMPLPFQSANTDQMAHLAFFESYFSNYIEGTEFEVDEAYQIVTSQKIITNRPEDSHDILGTYTLVNDPREMHTVPKDVDQLIELLRHRHYVLMQARASTMPGAFKDKVNRAGNTVFVKPDEMMGTLEKGFELYQSLPPGFHKAAYMMFLVSEVHPFLDGNGRIARIMMNAELVSSNEWRIIIPTVYREDYLLALRQLSHNSDPHIYIRMLEQAQQFTASIDYRNYKHAVATLATCHAFQRSSEGKLKILKY